MIAIDHVLFAVTDLEEADVRFQHDYGLTSVAGGRHPGWGTANRIIPLGDCYLELISVVDKEEAADSPFGSWVLRAHEGKPIGWAVRTDDIVPIAQRLRLSINDGSRRTPKGALLRWRSAGVIEAAEDPCLPFFIQWAEGTQHPGRREVQHPAGPVRLSRLELRGDHQRLAQWLAGAELPITIVPGSGQVVRIGLSGPAGVFYLP